MFYLPAPRTLLGTCGSLIKVYNPTNWHRQAEAEPTLAGQRAGWAPEREPTCQGWAARGGHLSACLAKAGERVRGFTALPVKPLRGHISSVMHSPKGSFETPPLHLEMTLEILVLKGQ